MYIQTVYISCRSLIITYLSASHICSIHRRCSDLKSTSWKSCKLEENAGGLNHEKTCPKLTRAIINFFVNDYFCSSSSSFTSVPLITQRGGTIKTCRRPYTVWRPFCCDSGAAQETDAPGTFDPLFQLRRRIRCC